MKPSIVIVGEAWGEKEEEKGRPFVGPSGHLLNSFLASAGIERRECYLTNVFNFRPQGNRLLTLAGSKARGIPGMPQIDTGKYILAEYEPELKRLYREIEDVGPNLVIALGGTACWAVLRDRRIKRLRGAPIEGVTGHKVLATYHPAAVLREYKLRPIVYSDFEKARRESLYPDVRRPQRELWLAPNLEDMAAFERYILESEWLSVDIETWNRQITCIGFAPSIDRAIVVPFIHHGSPDGNYWRTFVEEKQAWEYVRRWLQYGKKVVGQNFLYDCNYLWSKYGTPVYDVEGDTMLLSHAMQPEMEKSLALLGTLWTDEPPWKWMREDIKTLKKED